ncbi:MAG: 4-amino-4-deoxychorismate lyase [Pseudomonadota bacterium]
MSTLPLEIRIDGQPAGAHAADAHTPDAKGWPLDRGLHFGDGVFETLVVRGGRARFASLHRARLARGLARLQISLDEDAAWREVSAVATAHAESLLKLLVTRGDATERGYAPSGREHARRVLLVYPATADPSAQPADAAAVTLATRLGENPLLAGLKHTNRLEQVLARTELAPTGAFEGLMANSSALLVSGTLSNVFVRLDGQWLTPRLDRCGIAGVMRAVVLREAARADLLLREAEIPLAALPRCESLYVSNVRLGLRPLASLDGRALVRDAALDALARKVERLDD